MICCKTFGISVAPAPAGCPDWNALAWDYYGDYYAAGSVSVTPVSGQSNTINITSPGDGVGRNAAYVDRPVGPDCNANVRIVLTKTVHGGYPIGYVEVGNNLPPYDVYVDFDIPTTPAGTYDYPIVIPAQATVGQIYVWAQVQTSDVLASVGITVTIT